MQVCVWATEALMWEAASGTKNSASPQVPACCCCPVDKQQGHGSELPADCDDRDCLTVLSLPEYLQPSSLEWFNCLIGALDAIPDLGDESVVAARSCELRPASLTLPDRQDLFSLAQMLRV